MRARVSVPRRLPRPAWVLVVLMGGLTACPPPPPDPGDLLPVPPAELPDLGGRAVRVGLPANSLPYSRIDAATGTVEGFDVDLITELAERLNFTPEFVTTDPNVLLSDLAAGRIDLAGGGIAFTVDRAAAYDFVSPYGLVKLRLAVRAGDNRAATIAAFHDAALLRVGAWRATRTEELASGYFGAARVAGFDSTAAAVDALVAGQVDGVALDDPELAREQGRRPGQLVGLPGPLGGDISAYVLPLGSDLSDPLDDAFLQLREEGEVAALRAKWGL